MYRVHPTENRNEAGDVAPATAWSDQSTSWTVWKKSSMAFQGTDGFSVYDASGHLAFRVDNYSRRHRYLVGDVALMDGAGRVLFSLRPQIFSMHEQWNGFKGENSKKTKMHVFSMKKRSILQHGDEAEVFMVNPTGQLPPKPDFRVEGCFWRRCCKIRRGNGDVVARMSRKKANTSVFLSDDVFSLVVNPGVDCELIMAFMVVMDRICQKPFNPILCASHAMP